MADRNDEVAMHLDANYVAAPEATWRITDLPCMTGLMQWCGYRCTCHAGSTFSLKRAAKRMRMLTLRPRQPS
eukprot:1691990-Karenia_brevis.AAC.1